MAVSHEQMRERALGEIASARRAAYLESGRELASGNYPEVLYFSGNDVLKAAASRYLAAHAALEYLNRFLEEDRLRLAAQEESERLRREQWLSERLEELS